MASVTKTFSYFTVTVIGTDQTVSDDFTLAIPTVKAKHSLSDRPYVKYQVGLDFNINNAEAVYELPSGYAMSNVKTPSNLITVNPTSSSKTNITLSSIFNQTNKTDKTIDITATSYGPQEDIWLACNNTNAFTGAYYSEYLLSSTVSWGKVATITLNAPPTATLGTPTYSNPQYAGLGSYTVPITTASALYGGDITKVTLTVGQDSTVQTYSSSTITSQTISVTPTIAGTYTPTLTVEDSRGQTKVETLADIVVNPYLAPSFDFDVFRSDSSGVRDDEGVYGLITANVSFTDAIADLTQPTVKINGTTTNNVTWYTAYNASTGVSGAISDWSTVSSGDTIYGLINGSFAQTDSYQITMSLEDSLGGQSSAITQTLSTAFYTIDFQAGGKEIAFGLPANDNLTSYPNGLFKCGMDAVFNDTVTINGDLTATGDTTLSTGDTEIENPYFSLDTTASPGTTDGDLYAAIVDLGWDSDVIV